jgi:hypothetical protein
MQFGIFGAAQAGGSLPSAPVGQGFHDFIDFNVEAEALGYHSTFLVEHHFTGWNQVSATLLIYASIFAAIAIFGFAWWLRNHISKEHIKNELDSLKQKVSLQEAIINDLRSTGGVPRTQVELLNSANATVVSSLAGSRAGEYGSR